MNNKVFISYAHLDAEICRNVCDLFRRKGVDIWHDEEGLPPEAEDFNDEIEAAIDASPFFVCVWTQNIKHSDYCGKELKRALEWKKREPKKRSVFVFKMEGSLDDLRDLPPGCNILCTGDNFVYAFTQEKLENAVDKVAEYLFGKLECGEEYNIAVQKLSRYAENELSKYQNIQDRISRVIECDGKCTDIVTIMTDLKNGHNLLLEGKRGCGKTLILLSIHKALLQQLRATLTQNDPETGDIYIPVYAKLDELWGVSTVVNRVVFSICKMCDVPYCTDKHIKYIFILDGNLGSSRGNLPEAANLLIDPKSGAYSKIIGHCDNLLLPCDYKKLSVQLLSFAEIVSYITSNISDATMVSKFFYGLLKRDFEDSCIEENDRNAYFLIIKKIYSIFKNDNSFEKGGSFRSDVDGFYDLNLARTTQRGRLPAKLTEEEVCTWKRLIICNEVFSAIRNPYYLQWLVKLYLAEKDFTFPHQLKTLHAMIGKKTIASLPIDEDLRQKIIVIYLHTLATSMQEKYGENHLISRDEFRNIIHLTNFEQVISLLTNNEVLLQVGTDLIFAQSFFYDYFLLYTGDNSSINLEANLRTCAKADLVQNFFAFISNTDPPNSNEEDPIELAARIIFEERGAINLTTGEKELVYQIARNRYQLSNSYIRKASIMTGIGLLFDDMTLILSDENLFNLENKELWIHINKNDYLLKYPVSNFFFQKFVRGGYQNKTYWRFGTQSLLLENGRKRSRPLPIDESNTKIFSISNCPVVGITWYEARAFCNWLEEKIGNTELSVELPSIDDVEILMRGRLDGKNFNGKNGINFEHTSPVGLFVSRDDEFADLIGNVWEWSNTGYEFEGDYIQVCYGGAWGKQIDADHIKTTYPARLSSNNIGFRVIVKRKI